MLLPHGSPGFYSYGVGEDEEEADSSPESTDLNPPVASRTLNDRLEMAEREEAPVEAMDISPAAPRRRSSIHEEEMPDLEQRSSPANFRALDQRTSFQLGKTDFIPCFRLTLSYENVY